MQITIQHNDIEQAIKEFLANKGLTMEGKDVSVSFQTTRKGGPKVSAVVSFTDKAKAIPGFANPDLVLVDLATSADRTAVAKVDVAPVVEEEAELQEQETQNAEQHQAAEEDTTPVVETAPSLFGG